MLQLLLGSDHRSVSLSVLALLLVLAQMLLGAGGGGSPEAALLLQIDDPAGQRRDVLEAIRHVHRGGTAEGAADRNLPGRQGGDGQ